MKNRNSFATAMKAFGLTLTLGVSMSACSETSWKEEVLLHDGSKTIATRSQNRGGRGEIGQSPIRAHEVTFTLPGSYRTITWRDEYSEDVGHSNFNLLALHILNGTAYIVTSPYGSSAYKKWGSPNPPYVFFKYDRGAWERISLPELPMPFKSINLVVNTSTHEKRLVEEDRLSGFVSVASIKKLNSSLTQEEVKTIVRTPLEIWKPRPENLSSKAPQPIGAPVTVPDSKK